MKANSLTALQRTCTEITGQARVVTASIIDRKEVIEVMAYDVKGQTKFVHKLDGKRVDEHYLYTLLD